MATIKKDNNSVNIAAGVLNTDGETPTMLEADPSDHSLDVDDNTTGSDAGSNNASRDDNRVTTLLAVSSSDESTPVPLFVDSDGNLLVDST